MNRGGDVWIYGETTAGEVTAVVSGIIAKGIELASNLGVKACIILAGSSLSASVEHFIHSGVDRVYVIDDEKLRFKDDQLLGHAVSIAARKYKPQILLVCGTIHGRAIAPWIASNLGTGVTADCTDLKIDLETGRLLQIRPAASGNLMAEIICEKRNPQIASVRPKVFEPIEFNQKVKAEQIHIMLPKIDIPALKQISAESFDDALHLDTAEIVLAGGRGIGKDGFIALKLLADLMGDRASIAATRVAVDSGWIDFKYQVGQTGVIVKPKLYYAFGISGAIEHIIGMSLAEKVIAVNTDSQAEIFRYAHYKIIGDANSYIISMIKRIKADGIKEV